MLLDNNTEPAENAEQIPDRNVNRKSYCYNNSTRNCNKGICVVLGQK